MDRLRKYIISNFTVLFFSIFIPLFAIASVIFLIKLATYTSVIQVSVWEMFKLYLFVLPELLFYTLPVTFLVAAALTLHKLSTDNEIVVIFAMGIKPSFIIKTLLKPAILLMVLLSFNFLVMFPHATVLSTNFLRYKKSEANFNLSASEFGHNFGDWLLYIGKSNPDNSYGDVFLFHKDVNEELLIGAKKAQVMNDKGVLTLKLSEGQGYGYTDTTLSQMNFEEMAINNVLVTDLRTYLSPIKFWLDPERRDNKIKMFITDVLLSVFPVISLFFIVAVSVIHERHQKGHIYLSLFLAILLYYGAVIGLQDLLQFYTIPLVITVWLSVTYLMYKKQVLAHF
ncbi:MAG: LptF/LptG family permease [Campylobacterota bacterium]|nr:LptF/LptG family permease [Campylobacterota bacterium]